MFPGRATCEPYRTEQRFAGKRSATSEWAAKRCGFGDPPQIDAERAGCASPLGEHGADDGNVLLLPAVTLSAHYSCHF
jgi:hypothetical protein